MEQFEDVFGIAQFRQGRDVGVSERGGVRSAHERA